jgi:hypothetical protein
MDKARLQAIINAAFHVPVTVSTRKRRKERFMLKVNCLVLILCVSISFTRIETVCAKDQDSAAEKVIAEHLKSIGNAEVLAAIKSRAFVGTSSVDFIQGMSGNMSGNAMFVSEGKKLAIVMKYGDLNYPGEYFAFDGKDVSVGYMSPGQKSPLADFLFRNNGLIKEGLLGGVLSGAWPLLDLKNNQVELKQRETTVEGRRLYEIEYIPKNRLGSLTVKMYFDPDTFHHVRTDYRMRIRDDMSGSPGGPSGGRFILREGLPDSIYVLIEKFDDFKKVGDLTLPQSYSIDYSVEGQGHTFVAKWNLKSGQWDLNKAYDERIFKAQK